ncbi:hypothetical protein CHRY9390_02737 [Chryseobacterium aquaeductus]|uniref:Uncharacterized protein n=1 Tax=Chryseobacterium aquaeductus TaxID=2675056 RepID=A0A9N8MJL5_9FLAO|nr:hypothetical protein [Chryseobacterium aquaeductus]CAA7332016.1 hypothetical protein CHRY9390_02737 [Chryseobacterium potabilaquae]CAD7813972.1 hypothetical protein CHRY9390_02737 [Chryseobacterium aquaeductus]
MKNLLLISFTLFLNLNEIAKAKSDVYLCDSNGGKKYHYTKNCRGLSNCKHEIIKVSLKKAQTLGKTLCVWED